MMRRVHQHHHAPPTVPKADYPIPFHQQIDNDIEDWGSDFEAEEDMVEEESYQMPYIPSSGVNNNNNIDADDEEACYEQASDMLMDNQDEVYEVPVLPSAESVPVLPQKQSRDLSLSNPMLTPNTAPPPPRPPKPCGKPSLRSDVDQYYPRTQPQPLDMRQARPLPNPQNSQQSSGARRLPGTIPIGHPTTAIPLNNTTPQKSFPQNNNISDNMIKDKQIETKSTTSSENIENNNRELPRSNSFSQNIQIQREKLRKLSLQKSFQQSSDVVETSKSQTQPVVMSSVRDQQQQPTKISAIASMRSKFEGSIPQPTTPRSLKPVTDTADIPVKQDMILETKMRILSKIEPPPLPVNSRHSTTSSSSSGDSEQLQISGGLLSRGGKRPSIPDITKPELPTKPPSDPTEGSSHPPIVSKPQNTTVLPTRKTSLPAGPGKPALPGRPSPGGPPPSSGGPPSLPGGPPLFPGRPSPGGPPPSSGGPPSLPGGPPLFPGRPSPGGPPSLPGGPSMLPGRPGGSALPGGPLPSPGGPPPSPARPSSLPGVPPPSLPGRPSALPCGPPPLSGGPMSGSVGLQTTSPGPVNSQSTTATERRTMLPTLPHRPQLGGGTPVNNRPPNNIILPLESYNWFHPSTNRAQARHLLEENGMNGAYLVRHCSEKDGRNFTLSLYHNGSPCHLNIRCRDDNKYALGSRKEIELTFDTVVKLIEYHKDNVVVLAKDQGSTRLLHPIEQKK